MRRRKTDKGLVIETYELSSEMFDKACEMLTVGMNPMSPEKLLDSDEFVDNWIEDKDFSIGYRKWLQEKKEQGADIFTYYLEGQPVGEIAAYTE